jgi:hypothetical protein
MGTFEQTRPMVVAQPLGIARAALEYMTAHAKEREAFGAPSIVAPDTGSLRSDMHALTKIVARNLNTSLGRSLLRALVIDDRGLCSDETGMVFWRQRSDAVRMVLDHAAERGEMRDGVDTVWAVQLTLAPINVRAQYTQEPIPDAYCEVIADLAWHAIAKR